MKISYAITTHNEIDEIKKLIPFLNEYKRQEDEIVVVDDNSDEEMIKYLTYCKGTKDFGHDFNHIDAWYNHDLNNHFGDHKNYLNSKCTGDYIFSIDADESMHKNLILNLPAILEKNDVDVIHVPRINTVEGLTEEHIQKWHWHVNENGWINFPDYQSRIYKNSPEMKWENAVHEIIVGANVKAALPAEEIWCLYHYKDIKKQELQNAFYETI